MKTFMKNIEWQGTKTKKTIYQSLVLYLLGVKIKKHFNQTIYIDNDWTDYKHGMQFIRPIKELYTDGRYVYSNGVPLYDIINKKFNS